MARVLSEKNCESKKKRFYITISFSYNDIWVIELGIRLHEKILIGWQNDKRWIDTDPSYLFIYLFFAYLIVFFLVRFRKRL